LQWIRFEPHRRVPEIVRTVPHIAFAVDDLDEALKGREILIALPERETVTDFSQGVPLATVQKLARYWGIGSNYGVDHG